MWVLTGPFDGELGADLNLQKSKLLKTGTSYPLGRKNRPLCIASKKVSHDHCEFVVGAYTADKVSNPSTRPSVEFINKKSVGIRVIRDGVELIAGSGRSQELQDGDIIHVITGVPVKLTWHEVCCFSLKPSLYSIDACASLGINLVHILDRRVTHHLTPVYETSPLIGCSLVAAAQFVKPEWLHEVIRLGGETSLEQSFVLPPINKFRPEFSPSLSPSYKDFSIWEPNEERLHMLADFHFTCVGTKPKLVDDDVRELVSWAGGTLDIFEVTAGAVQFHRTLTREHKKKGKLILVADSKAMMAAIGRDEWHEFASEAKSLDYCFINPDVIVQAVIGADATIFDKAFVEEEVPGPLRSMSPPNLVSNTLPDEPSQVSSSQPPKKNLIRRATSRQPSAKVVAPSLLAKSENVENEAPKARRTLTRRVNAGKPMVTGLDDPSIILDAAPEISVTRASPPPKPIIDLTAPTPARSNRLKRRIVGVAADKLETYDIPSTINETSEEPPLKKFKALFDESDPDRIIAESLPEESQSLGGSFTQTQTHSGFQSRTSHTFATTTNLSLLREEEESQSLSSIGARGTKRTLDSVEDEHTDVVEGVTDKPAPKRRAIETANSVERSTTTEPSHPTSSKTGHSVVASTGAAPGKPDKDAAFLKAIASTKRGKKSEDSFDREFNNLKISKPDLDREEREREWNVLADFGDDSGIRGNFMTIVDLPPFIKTKSGGNEQSTPPQWANKPNFKKFKRKNIERNRGGKVELVLVGGDNDESETSSWKDGTLQSQDDFYVKRSGKRDRERCAPRKPSVVLEDVSSDDAISSRRASRSRPPSKVGSSTAKSRNTRDARSTPLFLDSDDDIKEETGMEYDDSQTLQSNDTRNAGARRKTTSFTNGYDMDDDDDSDDDDGVFKGFATAKTTRTRRQ